MCHLFLLSKQVSGDVVDGGSCAGGFLLVSAQNGAKNLGSRFRFAIGWVAWKIAAVLLDMVGIYTGHEIMSFGEMDRVVGFGDWLGVMLTILIVEIRLQRLHHSRK